MSSCTVRRSIDIVTPSSVGKRMPSLDSDSASTHLLPLAQERSRGQRCGASIGRRTEAAVEADGEEDVRRLRLAVRLPLVVWPALELDVLGRRPATCDARAS